MTNARPLLGELLLAHKICTAEQLRQAFDLKTRTGDRLGTNLLQLGFIDERRLSIALGIQHQAKSGAGVDVVPRHRNTATLSILARTKALTPLATPTPPKSSATRATTARKSLN